MKDKAVSEQVMILKTLINDQSAHVKFLSGDCICIFTPSRSRGRMLTIMKMWADR